MLKEFEGKLPIISEKAYVAEGAQLIGNVIMEEYSSAWHNVVIRGDINKIYIGKYTNVQDNSVLHVDDDYDVIIDDFVTVGHGAILHGCEVGDHCLIGMGAIVLSGAKIGRGSVIAAGALVKENDVIPPYSLVVGMPGKVIKQLSEDVSKMHSQAVKYKTLWTKRYGILPNADGETYNGEEIV